MDKRGPNARNTYFVYGIGGSGGRPEAWAKVAAGDSRLPSGTKVVIEIYQDVGVLTVNDTEGGIGPAHLDVFVGEMTIAEAFEYGKTSSRVGIVRE